MELFTTQQREQLLANGKASAESQGGIDHKPVVKLFTPDAGATWLLSELDPNDPDIAFGLCDLGLGCPELGSVYIPEIVDLRGKLGLPVERDMHFEARLTVGQYAERARHEGAVVTSKIHADLSSARSS